MTRFSKFLSVTTLVFGLAACDEKLSDVAGPTPTLEPTFTSIQRDVFNSTDSAGRRACTTCHNAQGARFSGNLNLADGTAYAQLVGVASSGKPGAVRIVAGDPDGSYLVQKIEGAPGIVGERMPRTGGPFLTPGQITIIRRWIQIGAPNN
jgi:hypothetical protein